MGSVYDSLIIRKHFFSSLLWLLLLLGYFTHLSHGLKEGNSTKAVSERPSFEVKDGTRHALEHESCINKTRESIWPKFDNDTKVITIAFLASKLTSNKTSHELERFGLKLPGAMSASVEKVNNGTLLPEGYKLRFEVYDVKSDVVESTKYVVDSVCKGISAFIGPDKTCQVEATIALSQNLPMINYACTDEKVSSLATFARTNPSEKPIIEVTVETLKKFNWKRITIVYYQEQTSVTHAHTLKEFAKKADIHINAFKALEQKKESQFLAEHKYKTRIFVLLSHRYNVPGFIAGMMIAGLLNQTDSKQYFVLYVDYEEYNTGWENYIWNTHNMVMINTSKICEESDIQAVTRSFMVVAVRPPVADNLEEFKNKVNKYNTRQPFCLKYFTPAEDETTVEELTRSDSNETTSKKERKKFNTHIPLTAAYLYDAVQLYAISVRALYDKKKKINPNITVEEVVKDGVGIKNEIIRRRFKSVLGYDIEMDDQGQSTGKYSVYYLHNDTRCSDKVMNRYNCSSCLAKIFDFENDTLIPVFENRVYEVPKDTPECGYDGSLCNQLSERDTRQIATIILAIVFVFLAFIAIMNYRNWKYELEIAGLSWRIQVEQLKFYNKMMVDMNESRFSLASAISHEMQKKFYKNIGQYKGSIVCVKPLKKQELTREIMKEMRNLRELKHDNICCFVGAYTDMNTVTLVTEYCKRGSLDDILEDVDVKLDELFISSLVNDLIKGMTFMHTHVGIHGNLKSTNCVITGRWVLQLTDYGLLELRKIEIQRRMSIDGLDTDQDAEQSHKDLLKSQLWMAPELIRATIESPAKPSKASDIYSFGIILHEIIARQGPYSISSGNSPDISVIINDIKSGATASGSMMRPSVLDMMDMPFGDEESIIKAMQKCWAEDPEERPEFTNIKNQLKVINSSRKKGNLMDHLMSLMEEHNKNLEVLVSSRTKKLADEKKRTDMLLHRMLPPSVASSLANNIRVEPQSYDLVTIYFSDIVGFTKLSSSSTPFQVVNFLDHLYSSFDQIIYAYDVYKVETIGDAYMVVSGLPNRNQERHAGEIASMAIELLQKTQANFKIPHQPDLELNLRIGMHSGPVMTGVVGMTMPRYCLFGDTVNTASRMESNGEPQKIHISKPCKILLDKLGGYITEERGFVAMKGKGEMFTYWLKAKTEEAIQRREGVKPPPFFLFQQPEENIIRRRSPRLSIDMRSIGGRTSSIQSYADDYEYSGSRLNHIDENSPNHRESPRSEKNYLSKRRLSNAFKTNSLECNTRGGLLSPPDSRGYQDSHSHKSSNSSCIKGSHSLDQLPSDFTLTVPDLDAIRSAASPSSSEPALSHNEASKGVNFAFIQNGDEESLTEGMPMLSEPNSRDESTQFDTDKKSPMMKFLGFMQGAKVSKHSNSSSKIPHNGVHRESVV